MKATALLICFIFSFNVFAGSIQDVERGLDEYHYALTVEWDQKDKKFYDEQTAIFFNVLGSALQEGVSNEEIINLISKKSHNTQDLEALKLKISLLGNKVSSPQELAALLKDSSKDFYQRGASWEGEVIMYVGFGLLAAALISYVVWFEIKYECVSSERYRDCDWQTDSDGDRYQKCEYKTRCLEYVERNPK